MKIILIVFMIIALFITLFLWCILAGSKKMGDSEMEDLEQERIIASMKQ